MKGISPLIAAVLLIAVTVSIATIVAGWFPSIIISTQGKVENTTKEATSCASASISIDDVFITAGSNGVGRAVVRNSGHSDDLVLVSAVLYNTTGNATSASVVSDFDRGEVVTLTFNNISVTSCPTDFSEIIVTTNCGGISTKFDRTPKCS